MVEETPGAGVDVRVRVLRLSVLCEDAWGDFVCLVERESTKKKDKKSAGVWGMEMKMGGEAAHHLDELDCRALHELRTRLDEVHERREAGVRRTEHTMSIARDDLSALKRLPQALLDRLMCDVVLANFLLHRELPAEHLLVCKTVERACEAEKTCGVGEVGVGEGRADEVFE